MVNGNAELLSILLINILENAVKFSPPDKDINVRLLEINQSVLIEVIDYGQGIKEDDKDKIFNRFHKSKIKAGNGLGLPIAKKIVKLLGGNISADNLSNPAGFIVKIHLPVA